MLVVGFSSVSSGHLVFLGSRAQVPMLSENQQNVFPHSSKAWKSEIKMLAEPCSL